MEDGEIYNSETGGAAYTESNWTPIGGGIRFLGIFDGDTHTVSGIYINSDSDNQGLFGVAFQTAAVIKNLGVEDSYIKGASIVGGVADISL